MKETREGSNCEREKCPLCGDVCWVPFHRDSLRSYLRCERCMLVFVPEGERLSPEDEKARYDLHDNSPDDMGYRRFLGRLHEPVNELLVPGAHGLDFGCGPGPTLSLMFADAGHKVVLYDIFYAKDELVFEKSYDFITSSEVVEHLFEPGRELARLWRCLKPGGVLGIMTKLVIDREAFSNWHYKNDDTHVCFFSKETFLWLARKWRTKVWFADKDVIIFTKPNP